jgi:hypothetical protein
MATSKHIRGYEVATLPARLVRTFRSATTRRRGWAASSPLPLLSGRRLMLPGLSSKIHLWEVSDVYVLSIMQESVAKVMEDSFVLKGLSEYRRSGSNRHGALAPPDFESGASTNSATPACRTATLYQCTQPVRHQRRMDRFYGTRRGPSYGRRRVRSLSRCARHTREMANIPGKCK